MWLYNKHKSGKFLHNREDKAAENRFFMSAAVTNTLHS